MRLPRLSFLFPRNDGRLWHCEAFLRRGNLFKQYVIARKHDVAICLFVVSIMRLPRHSFLFPRNDGGLWHCEAFLRRSNLFVLSSPHEITTSFVPHSS
jgi:hypothetical protein